MKNRWRLTTIVLFVCSLSVSSALMIGQDEGPIRVLPGSALPKHHLVDHFLSFIDAVSAEGPHFRESIYRRLGVEPGGEQEAALLRAVTAARALHAEPSSSPSPSEVDGIRENWAFGGLGPNPSQSGEPFTEEMRAQELERARELAKIYRELARDLEASGGSIGGIEGFLESDVAGWVTLGTDQPFEADDFIWELEEVFLEELEREP